MSVESFHDPTDNLEAELTSWRELAVEQRRENLMAALPENCQRGCTIAKMVIDRILEEGIKGNWVRENLAECPGEPSVPGQCSTRKNVCSHPEAGSTDNFPAQINQLYRYVQSNPM